MTKNTTPEKQVRNFLKSLDWKVNDADEHVNTFIEQINARLSVQSFEKEVELFIGWNTATRNERDSFDYLTEFNSGCNLVIAHVDGNWQLCIRRTENVQLLDNKYRRDVIPVDEHDELFMDKTGQPEPVINAERSIKLEAIMRMDEVLDQLARWGTDSILTVEPVPMTA